MKILIAEDEMTTRLYLVSLLEKQGHEVVACENGSEAWLAMQAVDAPQMALLDWMMPGMDGSEICRRVRTLNREIKPYIIILTVKNAKADIISALDAGADDYLSKPYDPGELFARINVGLRIINLQKALVSRLETLRANEERIEGLLAEKVLILKEVHHRIKNNMNTIYGFLVLQAGIMTDPLSRAALEDAGSRVQSMMLLYANLYESENFNEIAVAKYFPVLIDEIISSFPGSGTVTVKKNIGDFRLSAKKTQPLGIILNELLTNIMKYAFLGKKTGIISVSASISGSRVTFTIEDDGNGMPESVDFGNSTGFGLVLVGELTKQLSGDIRIERKNGTKIVLEFDK